MSEEEGMQGWRAPLALPLCGFARLTQDEPIIATSLGVYVVAEAEERAGEEVVVEIMSRDGRKSVIVTGAEAEGGIVSRMLELVSEGVGEPLPGARIKVRMPGGQDELKALGADFAVALVVAAAYLDFAGVDFERRDLVQALEAAGRLAGERLAGLLAKVCGEGGVYAFRASEGAFLLKPPEELDPRTWLALVLQEEPEGGVPEHVTQVIEHALGHIALEVARALIEEGRAPARLIEAGGHLLMALGYAGARTRRAVSRLWNAGLRAGIAGFNSPVIVAPVDPERMRDVLRELCEAGHRAIIASAGVDGLQRVTASDA